MSPLVIPLSVIAGFLLVIMYNVALIEKNTRPQPPPPIYTYSHKIAMTPSEAVGMIDETPAGVEFVTMLPYPIEDRLLLVFRTPSE